MHYGFQWLFCTFTARMASHPTGHCRGLGDAEYCLGRTAAEFLDTADTVSMSDYVNDCVTGQPSPYRPKPTPSEHTQAQDRLSYLYEVLDTAIKRHCPESRERSIALTYLQDSCHRAIASLTHGEPV